MAMAMRVGVLCEVVAALGEAPVWQPAEGRLWWIDLARPALHRLTLASGVHTALPLDLPAPLGMIVATQHPDRLVLAHRGGLGVLDVSTGALAPLAKPEAGREAMCFNDGKVDRAGRLWFGSDDLAETEPRGLLWSLAPGEAPALEDAGFAVVNGPAFSPDGRTLYLSDSNARRILAYDLAVAPPRLRNRRLFATMVMDEGVPDGMTVDALGCLWVAHWDGWRVTRFSPAGERLAVVPMPVPRVTSLVFAGPALDRLVVTTAYEGLSPALRAAAPLAGALFEIEAGVAGLAERPFALG